MFKFEFENTIDSLSNPNTFNEENLNKLERIDSTLPWYEGHLGPKFSAKDLQKLETLNILIPYQEGIQTVVKVVQDYKEFQVSH